MKKFIAILISALILFQITIGSITIAKAEISKPVFKGFFQNVDYSDPSIFLQSGKQTEITPRIKEIADSIKNKEGMDLIAAIYNKVKRFPSSTHHEHDFYNNTANQLLDTGLTGCTDWGIAFAAIARAKNIPTVFIQAGRMDWVEDYIKNSDNQGMFRGHILVECYLQGEWYLVDTQAGRIYLKYNKSNFSLPDGEYIFAKSIEVFDMGTEGEAHNTFVMRKCFKKFDANKYKDPCYDYYKIEQDGNLTFFKADVPFILKRIKEKPLVRAGLVMLENGNNMNLINSFTRKFNINNYHCAYTFYGFLHTDIDNANVIIFHDLSVSDKYTFKNIYEYPYVKSIFPEIDNAKPGDIITKNIKGKIKILFVTYGKDENMIKMLTPEKMKKIGITSNLLKNNTPIDYGKDNTITQFSKLTPSEMTDDFNQLLDILSKVHPKTNKGFSSNQQMIISKIKNSIKKEMSREDFYFLINELMVSFNDRHTSINYSNNNVWANIPLVWLKDGIYINQDTSTLKKGDKIVSIGNKNTDKLMKGLKDLVSTENEYWVKEKAKVLLTMGPFLRKLGVVDKNTVHIKIERDGKIKDIKETLTNNNNINSMKHKNWVGWNIYKEHSLGIFYLDVCNNNEEYNKNLKEFFEAVSKDGIKNIAIDLRYNTGGDSSVIDSFLQYTNAKQYKWYGSFNRYSEYGQKQLSWEPSSGEQNCNIESILVKNNDTNYNGNVYVLIGGQTFSSALMFAEIIKANNIGKLIGEPTGNSPSHYGYPLRFTLNNSEFDFTVSHIKWYCPSGQNDLNSLYPDIQAYETIDSILKDIDPAVNEILNLCSGNHNEYLNINKKVPSNKTWTIKFNKNLKRNIEINPGDDTINIKNINGETIPIKIEFGKNEKELIVTPITNYIPGETYYLTIGLGIKSSNEKNLLKPLKVRFTVQE